MLITSVQLGCARRLSISHPSVDILARYPFALLLLLLFGWATSRRERISSPPRFCKGGGSVVFKQLLLGWWLYHFIFVWSWNWIDCAGGGGSAIFWYLALVLLLLCGSGQNREFSTYPNDIHSRKQATKAGRKNASKRGEEKYKSRWRPTERT